MVTDLAYDDGTSPANEVKHDHNPMFILHIKAVYFFLLVN